MTKWFIDALDARGGLAVASRRDADLMEQAPKDSGPSVFISPPAFRPEFMDSRAVGFGLARMQAQTGLFLEKAEVPFDNLPAVVEFVRRAYLRGTGGDGPAENGVPGPMPRPVPGERPRPSPERPREGARTADHEWKVADDDPVRLLMTFADEAATVSRKLGLGQSGPPRPPPPGGGRPTLGSTAVNGGYRLARGGYWLVEEIVQRRPKRASDEFLDWLIAVNRLICLLARMSLWQLVSMLHRSMPSNVLIDYLGSPFESYEELPLRALIGQEYVTERWGWDNWAYLSCGGASDLMDDLAVLPVPPEMVPFAHPDGQNLQALLAGLMAVPTEILSIADIELRERCVELILFAAAALNLDGDTAPSKGIFRASVPEKFADRLVGRALVWMDYNLPKLVFSEHVEKLISSASKVPA